MAVGSTTYAAPLAVAIVALELLTHGWDLADAIGTRVEVDAATAEHVLGRARELVSPDKRGRGFAPEVTPPAGADAVDRLAAFTGRTPIHN